MLGAILGAALVAAVILVVVSGSHDGSASAATEPAGALSPTNQPTTPGLSTTATTATVPPPTSPTPTPAPTGPAATVEAYINAINQHDYLQAWQLGGDNTGGTFASFEAGYSTTANDVLTVESVDGEVVTARLSAEQSDGTVKEYEGTYTVSGGAIVAFDVRQTG